MLYPAPLKQGDTIAIISPATIVKPEYVEGAAREIESRGFRAQIMPHAMGPASGSYASDLPGRLSDLTAALQDPQVKAILCARGGYGCVHLLEHISTQMLRANPKHLVGFSDVSALHALWQKAGIISLHAPMAKHLCTMPADDPCTCRLFSLLTSPAPGINYSQPSSPLSIPGKTRGRLTGGNLAVISHLISTPYDPFACPEESILFIEDVSEAIYATERMLWQLKLSGTLERFRGIVVGAFNENRLDKNFPDTHHMIADRLRRWGITCPVAMDFPAGHIDNNLPLPLGAEVSLEVNPSLTNLSLA